MTVQQLKTESITGDDLSGSNGATSRTYTLAYTSIVSGSLDIHVDGAFLYEGASKDYTISSNTVTFINNIWDNQNIEISYLANVTDTSINASSYASTIDLARFMNIEGTIPDMTITGSNRTEETIGTGDGSTTIFYLDHGYVLASSYTISYGASVTSTTNLTETTHYTLDKDTGKLTLTSAGVTAVSTNNVYGAYSYCNVGLTDTQLQDAINRSVSEIEEDLGCRFVDGTDTTPGWLERSKEKHTGQGKYWRRYSLDKYPVAEIYTTLDGDHTSSITTITVSSTDGFPSSGTIGIATEKITYTGKTSTTFTGCTRGVDDTTGTAQTDGDIVTSWVVEISTTAPGSAITWQMLQTDVDYDMDFKSGTVQLHTTDLLLDSLSLMSPPSKIGNRFRCTYLSGHDTIPNNLKRLVLMVAAKDLLHMAVRKAHSAGLNGFNPNMINVDESWMESTKDRYRNIMAINT